MTNPTDSRRVNFMKYLKKSDLNLVKPKFRQKVLDAWAAGEQVPHSVIYLSDAPPTQKDIDYAKKLIKQHKINDHSSK